MRSEFEPELQKEWSKMSWGEKMAKLRSTSMDVKYSKKGKFYRTIEGYIRFTERLRNYEKET